MPLTANAAQQPAMHARVLPVSADTQAPMLADAEPGRPDALDAQMVGRELRAGDRVLALGAEVAAAIAPLARARGAQMVAVEADAATGSHRDLAEFVAGAIRKHAASVVAVGRAHAGLLPAAVPRVVRLLVMELDARKSPHARAALAVRLMDAGLEPRALGSAMWAFRRPR